MNRNFSEKHDRFWTGFALVIIGTILFADKLGVNFPDWLFTWPMILILVGLISGIKKRFQDFSWLIITGIGVFFLWDEMVIDVNLRQFFWPVLIIGLGILFILRPRKNWQFTGRNWEGFKKMPGQEFEEVSSSDDVVSSTSIFGGVKKIVTSKNFKGGEIICFMGGAEINLSQADITGPITLEIVQAFGATKLVVPPHWEIRSDVVAIFAGSEDKRQAQPGNFDPNKILIIKGITVFGGIEIKSY